AVAGIKQQERPQQRDQFLLGDLHQQEEARRHAGEDEGHQPADLGVLDALAHARAEYQEGGDVEQHQQRHRELEREKMRQQRQGDDGGAESDQAEGRVGDRDHQRCQKQDFRRIRQRNKRQGKTQRLPFLRRAFTAAASVSRSSTESSQPMQGSVMLWPNFSSAGALPGTSSCFPSTRCDSTIAPMMQREPPATWPATSRATSIWRLYCLDELACEKSIIRRHSSLDFASSSHAALMLAAS